MPDAAPSAPAVPAAAPAPGATDPKAAADAAAAKPSDSPKHKVKIDGEEKEIGLDELINGYQTNAAGQKRLKEAAEKEKSLGTEREKFTKAVTAMKSGDYEALKELGLSENEIEQLSVKVLSKKQQSALEEERRKALDPEKRELEDLRRDKEARDKSDKDRDEKTQQETITKATDDLRGNVISTLDLLPEKMRGSSFFANRALEAWEYAIEHQEEIEKRGIKVTPQLIADKVKAEATELYKNLVTSAKDEELGGYISDEVLERALKRKNAAPGAAAGAQHPAMGGAAKVRTGNEKKPEDPKRMTDAQLVRRVTLKR